ncbi:MAG: ATPase [Thermoleophilaceae bacterium]|nr:ATPase [Thermoleophilaceae bacterium]
MTPAALAVDAGQTETRAALTDGRGLVSARAGGVLRLGAGAGADDVAATLLEALAGLGTLPEPVPPAGVGLSGFEAATESDLRRVSALLRRELGIERLAIASDGLTSLLGALGDRPGAVVAAGTGAVCVARKGDRMAKVDGWGSLLSDAGSGFAIGRAGLDAALRHADGRPGSAALLAAAERRFGPATGLPQRVHGAPVPTREVASFAADVARVSAAGDDVAAAILREAGRELGVSACAALGRLFAPGDDAAVSYTGRVFQAGPLLLEPFMKQVRIRRPRTEIVPPAGDSLSGAALLAERADALHEEPGILWKAA